MSPHPPAPTPTATPATPAGANQCRYQPPDEEGIRKRLPTLIEILYGLGIASGIEQVGPKIVEGLDKPAKFDWQLLWCSVLAVFVSIADWGAYALQERPYRSGTRLLADVLGVILLFFLFTAAYSANVFLLVLCLYLFLAAAYPAIARREYPGWVPYEGDQEGRLGRAIFISMWSAAAVLVDIGGYPHALQNVALGVVTIFAIRAFVSLSARLREAMRNP